MSAPNTRAISLQTLQGHKPSEDFVTRLRACGSAVGGSIVIDMGADCGKAIWREYVALRHPVPAAPATKPWTPNDKARGLGDIIAKATAAVGIKPCGKCKERQAKLNHVVPFGKA